MGVAAVDAVYCPKSEPASPALLRRSAGEGVNQELPT